MPDPTPAVPIITTIFRYFSPAKSPFYVIVVAATLSLFIACRSNSSNFEWWLITPPLQAINIAAVLFAFRAKPSPIDQENHSMKKSELLSQLGFSRSVGVSVAALCIVLATGYCREYKLSFWLNYLTCIIQGVVFMAFFYISKKTGGLDVDKIGTNYVQLILITSSLLVGAASCNCVYAKNHPFDETQFNEGFTEKGRSSDRKKDKEIALESFKRSENWLYTTGLLFYLQWAGCMIFWGNTIRVCLN